SYCRNSGYKGRIGVFELMPVDNDIREMINQRAPTHVVRQAAIYRATHKLASACAFAGALAKARKATLVTGDSAFRVFEGQFKIQWLV
ncbi:MAG: hypothetical protein WCL44_13880, partial [bacterium]